MKFLFFLIVLKMYSSTICAATPPRHHQYFPMTSNDKSSNAHVAAVALNTSLIYNSNRNSFKQAIFRPRMHFTPPKGWMNDPNV